MAKVVLSAQKRTPDGSAVARRLRKTGRIPAVMYGRTGSAAVIDVDANEFAACAKRLTASTIVQVNIDGTTHEAFVKDTQRLITDGRILHVDFYEVESGELLRARVHVYMHGSPSGVRDGGVLETPLHEIEVECLPKDLPERIDVDIAGLGTNQSIHVRDLALGENVRLVSSGDQVVALVKYAKADAAAAEAEAAAAAAAPPAKGKGAPAAKPSK